MGAEEGGVSAGLSGAKGVAEGGEEKMYLPGDALPKDTELTVDPSAYITLNEWTTEWPCKISLSPPLPATCAHVNIRGIGPHYARGG